MRRKRLTGAISFLKLGSTPLACTYMYVSVYMHTYIHMYMYMYIDMHIHTYRYTYMYVYMYLYIPLKPTAHLPLQTNSTPSPTNALHILHHKPTATNCTDSTTHLMHAGHTLQALASIQKKGAAHVAHHHSWSPLSCCRHCPDLLVLPCTAAAGRWEWGGRRGWGTTCSGP